MAKKSNRSQADHFTIADDWVLLHPEVNHTQFRVYCLVKGNLPHSDGAPDAGFHVTAAWVEAVSGGLVSKAVAQASLRHLARLGVLRRTNNPHNGTGSRFQVVVDPGSDYRGPRSVMQRAIEVERGREWGSLYQTVDLDGHPSARRRGDAARQHARQAAAARRQVAADVEREVAAEVPPPAAGPVPDVLVDEAGVEATPQVRALAEELEIRSGRLSNPALHLFPEDCRRIAAACSGALERGWDVDRLTGRLLALLNDKIHSPGAFLAKRAAALGDPPSANRNENIVRANGRDIDLSKIKLDDVTTGTLVEPKPTGAGAALLRRGEETPEEKRARLALVARKALSGN